MILCLILCKINMYIHRINQIRKWYIILFYLFLAPVLSFNCSIIVLTMLRGLISKFRKSRIAFYFPLDSYLTFHIIIGCVIFIFGILHAVGYTLKYSKSLHCKSSVNLKWHNLHLCNYQQNVITDLNIKLSTWKRLSYTILKYWLCGGDIGYEIVMNVYMIVVTINNNKKEDSMFCVQWQHCFYL